MASVDIQITEASLSIQYCIDWVLSPSCGAIDVFIGTVRNATNGKAVVRLEFEAYESMALREMRKIAETVNARWPVERILIHHRIGILEVGEIPVIIAVAAGHRGVAFEGCRYAIDSLKDTVPIWKKEVYEDGESWVAAHP